MEKDLDIEVTHLLAGRKGDWPAIAEASGVSYSWLSKFFNGHIENPGFNTLKKIHQILVEPKNSRTEPDCLDRVLRIKKAA